MIRRIVGTLLAASIAAGGPTWAGQIGTASWYGPGFQGRKTASGTTFRASGLTMAHPTAPLGTKARVTNLRNGRSIIVRITDRGPHWRHRVADLSQGAARRLHMEHSGVAPVRITLLPSRKHHRRGHG